MNELDAKPDYAQSPRPIGYQNAYKIEGSTLLIEGTRKLEKIPLNTIRDIRLTYESRSFARHVYVTTVTLNNGRSYHFTSISWKGTIEFTRKDQEYSDFSKKLIKATALANPKARFIIGKPVIIWAGLCTVTAISLAGMAWFIMQAMLSGAYMALISGIVLAIATIWQMEPLLRLNKPASFDPLNPPAKLLPK